MKLTGSLQALPGIGAKTNELFSKLGIYTVGDLVFFAPRDYQDYSNTISVSNIQPGKVTLKGSFTAVSTHRSRRGLHVTTAVFSDETGSLKLVWFNQVWRAQTIPLQATVYVSGELKLTTNRFSIVNPVYEHADEVMLHAGRIVPIYKQTAGLTSSKIRTYIRRALDVLTLGSYLPNEFEARIHETLEALHFPSSNKSLEAAIDRMQRYELFEYILLGFLLRKEVLQLTAPSIEYANDDLKTFVRKLPFTLTDAQRLASWEIIQDMSRAQPMNRLLQGDVGSGKTVTAMFASYIALKAGYQVAVVAPTEIVVQQHMNVAQELLSEFKPVMLSSSLTIRQKVLRKKAINDGDSKLVIGTHAVLQPDVQFANLGLVIIDEQHRFGVKQRQMLRQSNKNIPHFLSMTATPIPRTLALTVFSDLDVSIINELPPNRKKVITQVGGPRSRKSFYELLATEIAKGHQVYVVCPLIEDSDVLGVTSVKAELKKITEYFKSTSVGALHGSLPPNEKEEIIHNFKKGLIDILVATTVVEVGVDVPNATAMLIEGAERFGLAQLHQLRGRVGRSQHQSYCLALTTKSKQAIDRLSAFANTTDGFILAQADLEQRGSGELYEVRQSGFLQLDTSLLSSTKVISQLRKDAQKFVDLYSVSDFSLLQYRLEKIRHQSKRN